MHTPHTRGHLGTAFQGAALKNAEEMFARANRELQKEQLLFFKSDQSQRAFTVKCLLNPPFPSDIYSSPPEQNADKHPGGMLAK